jgi:2-aminoethylphosphonate-pyruvate transaminase
MKKLLFTPGPLSTSRSVKEAMLEDVGSRDTEFIEAVQEIRDQLLNLAGISTASGFECVIMQGSGTFAIESVISSCLGPGDQLLILVNGAYGERMARIAAIHKITYHTLAFPEHEPVNPEELKRFLETHADISHLACVHCETTSGLFNPVDQIAAICRKRHIHCIVDAMSSFGGTPVPMDRWPIDFLISSSNKCIEGVPGFGFVLCSRTELEKCRGLARSLSLDLFDQWAGLKVNGQFRFTPPTLSLLAFRQALRELNQEGGVVARERRYKTNQTILLEGMQQLGFKPYLRPELRGHIISSFLYPSDGTFHFERFYGKLQRRGLIIYPGKLSQAQAFRIGHIGQLFPDDIRALLSAIAEIIREEEGTDNEKIQDQKKINP